MSMIKINIFNLNLFGESVNGTPGLERARRAWWSWRFRNERIRLSISALVRIQIDDKFLLVPNRRFRKYQPVGGVLKFHLSAKDDLESCGMAPDSMFDVDDTNRNDLRIMISGKHFSRFLKWYETGKGRESSPWREFHEELIAPGYLSWETFPHAQFSFLRRQSTGIRWSDHANAYECIITELFELHPNPEQESALRNLHKTTVDGIRWATAEEIRANGIVPKKQVDANIAETAKWLLPD